MECHLPVPPGVDTTSPSLVSRTGEAVALHWLCSDSAPIPRHHIACSPNHHQHILYFSPKLTMPMPTLLHCPITLLDFPFPAGESVPYLSLPTPPMLLYSLPESESVLETDKIGCKSWLAQCSWPSDLEQTTEPLCSCASIQQNGSDTTCPIGLQENLEMIFMMP